MRWLSLFLFVGGVAAQEWPQFRGPFATGVADAHPLPTEWNVETGDHVLWKAQVPGLAHSSPVVFGDKLWVTTAVRSGEAAELSSLYGSEGYGAGESVGNELEHEFALYCLDAGTGEILWHRVAHTGVPKVKRHPKSSHANPTPAVDADRIVAYFGSEGVFAYDHQGELLWARDLGVLNVGAPDYPDKDGFQWGVASSPVLHQGRVFLQCDHEGESFVVSLDAETGDDVWRTPRTEHSTWSTPTVHAASGDGHDQLIVNGYLHLGGYDLATGEEIWRAAGGGDVPVPTPVVADGLIYLTSSHGQSRPIRAVRVDAEGFVSDAPDDNPHLAWMHPRFGVYMQTPLPYRGRLYCCSDGGILSCYDATDGTRLYRKRLGGGLTGFSGSPVAGDGKIYFSAEAGEIHVVAAGDDFELLAVNLMGETCMSTPAIANGTIFVRTRHHVVAIRPE